MGTALRIAALVIVAVGVTLIDGSTASWVIAIVGTVVVGAVIARWWALLAPLGATVILLIGDRDETEVGWGTVALVFTFLLAVGVALGKAVRWPAAHRAAGREHA